MTIDSSAGIGASATSLNTPQAQGAEAAAKTGSAERGAVGAAAEEGISVGGKLMATDSMVGLLFVERAQVFGTLTKDRLGDVQDKLNHYKEMNRALQRMRNSKQQAGGHGHASEMDAETVAFCKEWDIKLDTTAHDNYHTKGEWDYNITSANGLREKWSNDLRILMTKLKAISKELDASVSGAGKVQDKSAHIAKQIFTG